MMRCPYCSSENTSTIYKAEMPNILSTCPEDVLGCVKVFPFTAHICRDCFLGFNSSKLNEDELKNIYDNYFYISPLAGIGCERYTGMIATLKKYFNKTDKIIEIGCSEGYLMKELRDEGFESLIGIEPGPQADKAQELGLNVVKGYFDNNSFEGEMFDGFYLMHVFEHLDDPFTILERMSGKLSAHGKIVIEVPYFTGFHHHHLFFYNLSFFKRLCRGKNLKIVYKSIERNELRLVIVHNDNCEFDEIEIDESPEYILKHAMGEYSKFVNQINRLNHIFRDNAGKRVYWWGAGSLSVIYLNQLEKDLLERVELVVVDGDKNKFGFHFPYLNLKVNPFSIIKDSTIETIIIASQFYNEIQSTMNKNNITAKSIEVIA